MLGGGGGGVFSVKNLMGLPVRGAISGGIQIAGEAGSYIVTDMVMPATTSRQSIIFALAQVSVGTIAGAVAQKFLGRQVGQDIVTGVMSGVARRQVKSLGIAKVNSALGASEGGGGFIARNGRWTPMSGYVGTGDQRLAGYVGTGDQRSALGDEQENELYIP
jgi:hypothetical protein